MKTLLCSPIRFSDEVRRIEKYQDCGGLWVIAATTRWRPWHRVPKLVDVRVIMNYIQDSDCFERSKHSIAHAKGHGFHVGAAFFQVFVFEQSVFSGRCVWMLLVVSEWAHEMRPAWLVCTREEVRGLVELCWCGSLRGSSVGSSGLVSCGSQVSGARMLKS